MKRWLRTAASRAGKVFDQRDAMFACGLGLLGYGAYLFQPWCGFAVPGAVIVCVAIFGVRR